VGDEGILGGMSGSGAVEDALVRYVVRELDSGRPLADVLTDAYVTNRSGTVDPRRLLDRREVIDAVGEDIVEDLRGKLGSL
jgi:hypothetical protein